MTQQEAQDLRGFLAPPLSDREPRYTVPPTQGLICLLDNGANRECHHYGATTADILFFLLTYYCKTWVLARQLPTQRISPALPDQLWVGAARAALGECEGRD